MTRKERFKNALLLKEVDKMPHGEQMIHDVLVAKILKQDLPGDDGNALSKWMSELMSKENFERHKKAREFLDFDYVQVFPMEPIKDIGTSHHGHRIVRDIWGAVQEISQESSKLIRKPIENSEEIAAYEFPQVDDFKFDNVKMWVDDGTFFVASQIDTGFFKISQLLGFEEYCQSIYFDKEALHKLMEKFNLFQMKLIDRLAEIGVDCIWLSDDHAFNSGPFISPELLQEFDFDYMKKLVDYCHTKGLPVILHSCGNLNLTIERIIATGINGLHALQPSAHNDIYQYKKQYGKQICLIGNLDINQLLPQGSPAEISLKVKEMVENCFYDRTGFILTTCNLLNIDTPVENAITMHLSAQVYGK